MIFIYAYINVLINLIPGSNLGGAFYEENNKEGFKKESPIEITISIQINKIYGINTTDETYKIDGYFVASWVTSESNQKKSSFQDATYENAQADEKMRKAIWAPAFEFINVVGTREIANKQLITKKNGKIIYNERFNAVFSTQMDFKSFPFDEQIFTIQLEAFSYDETKLVFSQTKNQQDLSKLGVLEAWNITNQTIYINTQDYSHLNQNEDIKTFSRYNQEITAKRKMRYYLWQFIIPLLIIISISWAVFWIPNLSDQLATNFTLMLTVVAFNFNTSNILPNLPYSTFIESLVTLGYLSIFLSLIIIIWGNYTRTKLDYKKLMHRCKYLFPCLFFLLVCIQLIIFF